MMADKNKEIKFRSETLWSHMQPREHTEQPREQPSNQAMPVK